MSVEPYTQTVECRECFVGVLAVELISHSTYPGYVWIVDACFAGLATVFKFSAAHTARIAICWDKFTPIFGLFCIFRYDSSIPAAR